MLFDAKLINTLYNPTHSCYSCYGPEINDGTDNKRKLEKYLGKNEYVCIIFLRKCSTNFLKK